MMRQVISIGRIPIVLLPNNNNDNGMKIINDENARVILNLSMIIDLLLILQNLKRSWSCPIIAKVEKNVNKDTM